MLTDSERALLIARTTARIELLEKAQKEIFRVKRENRAAVLNGTITVDSWIARIHKTNQQLDTLKHSLRDARKNLQDLKGKTRVGRFAVVVDTTTR